MFHGRRHFCNGNKLWKTSQLSFLSQLFVIEEVFLQNILYFILMLGCVWERSLLELSMRFQSTFRYLAMVTFLLFSFQVQLIEHHCFSPGGCDRISMECIASSYSGFAWLHRIGGLPSRVRKVEVLGSTLHSNVMWCSYIRWNRVVVYKIWYFNRIQCLHINLVTTNDCMSMILCFWFVDRMNLSLNIVANTLLVLRYRLLIIWNLQVLVRFNITIIFGHWLSIKDTGWHYETLPAVLREHWEQRKQCKYCWIGTYNWGNHKVLYNTAMHIFVIVCECLGGQWDIYF